MRNRAFISLVTGVMFWTLCLASTGNAQGQPGTISAGTTIKVRTNEEINTRDIDGTMFSAVVDENVMGRNRTVVIPRGSNAELVVRRMSNDEMALDLESVTVNGQRYGVQTENNVVRSEDKDGLGANKRTGKYVGGGAAIGAIVGAIAGGGKGAAIGAGVGAGAGAVGQILTRGKSVNVPAESLLTYRLTQPLQATAVNTGFSRSNSSTSTDRIGSAAYRDGLRTGRADWDRRMASNPQTSRWRNDQDRRDYEAGYYDGYQYKGASNSARQKPAYSEDSNGAASVYIGTDKNITWDGPAMASYLYVQVDNEAPKLFASGQSGTQPAPWITRGHVYTFTLKDANGNELARARRDLR